MKMVEDPYLLGHYPLVGEPTLTMSIRWFQNISCAFTITQKTFLSFGPAADIFRMVLLTTSHLLTCPLPAFLLSLLCPASPHPPPTSLHLSSSSLLFMYVSWNSVFSPFFSRLLHSLNSFLFFRQKKKMQSVWYERNRLDARNCVKEDVREARL